MAIDSRQLNELSTTLERNQVEYLYIGKSAAIIHGFADTTQDADIYVRSSETNKESLVTALKDLRFELTTEQEKDIRGGRDFVQLQNGPFDLDIVYAPDGIERFEEAWKRGRKIDGHRLCSMDDVIASKRAANRAKDRESLTRLEEFRKYLKDTPERGEKLPVLDPTWRDRVKAEIANDDRSSETGRSGPEQTRKTEVGRHPRAPQPAPDSAKGAGEAAEKKQQHQER